MNVVKYTQDLKNDWNSFLNSSKNSTFLFNRNFLDYHADRFRDHSLLVLNDNNQILAVLPANITDENILISHQGLTYGGLVIKKDEKLVNVVQFFREILLFLHNQRIDTLLYKEMPSFYNTLPSNEHQYIMFLTDAELYRKDITITVELNNELIFQKRRIRAIKTAEKTGIVIEEEQSFELFWKNILVPNLLKRFKVKPVHTIEEITFLHNLFPNNIKQFNAYLNGEIMAGVTIFETSLVAHAQYIGTSEEGRGNGSLDFLFYHLAKKIYTNKKYLDFGICNENEGRLINQGLLEWKEGFGGKAYPHNFYKIRTANFKHLENFIL